MTRDPLWVLAFLLLPFYIFPSGRPQPADLLLALASVGALSRRTHFTASARRLVLVLGAFVVWTLVVNLVWYLVLEDRSFLLTTLFYAFNGVVFVTTLLVAERGGPQLLRFLGKAASVILVVHVPVTLSGGTIRATAFFNNPNQLAFYALTMATLVLVVDQAVKLPPRYPVAALLATLLVEYLSASRAGVASALFLGLLHTTRRPAATLLLMLPAVIGAIYSDHLAQMDTTALWERRLHELEGADTVEDQLVERGFDRILDYPEYTIFGAGEGAYRRFSTDGLELHSSGATVLFCYGLPGIFFFGAYVVRLLSSARGLAVLIIPSLMYGLSHNAIRTRSWWIAMGVLVAAERFSRSGPAHAPGPQDA